MPHPIRMTLVWVVLLTTAAAARQAPGRPTLIALHGSYVAGDYAALRRAFPDAKAFDNSRRDMQATLRVWQKSWKPSQAAFLLDLSFLAFDAQWEDADELLAGLRDVVVNRPSRPGTNPGEDAFELAFHRAAVTFLISRQMLRVADAYVSALAGRVDLVPDTTGKPRLIDPWLTFARGMIGEIRTAPALRLDEARDEESLFMIADDSSSRRGAELAVATFERVKGFPSVAAEANVRRGLLLVRLGRADEALVAFDEGDAAPGDVTVRYWSALFRGRALEMLERPEEAAVAYERAASLIPGAQSPAVALAALWQLNDRPVEALRWAGVVMNAAPDVNDPWWLYWNGDLRHSGEVLQTLRRARP